MKSTEEVRRGAYRDIKDKDCYDSETGPVFRHTTREIGSGTRRFAQWSMTLKTEILVPRMDTDVVNPSKRFYVWTSE